MSMSLVANRYAKALFKTLGNNVETSRKQLEALCAVKEVFATKDGGKVLNSPVMPPDLKQALLKYGLDQANADDAIRNFVKVVSEAGRTALLPEIVNSFEEIIQAAEGKISAHLTSATALDDAEKQQISEHLGKILNKKVTLESTVNPDLLGGFVVDVGNYSVDMSLKTRIENLAQKAAH